jgi:class 3 adenylate cyclase/tetratricopeptide (TPR) repeat protein
MTAACPRCSAAIAAGTRFCGMCGLELPTLCAQCGTAAALPDQRFCSACGAPLRSGPAPERERRLVSVLFCDLVGFTSFSEKRDHEDVRDTLERYFTAARRVLGRYGGTLEKFIGDAVVAVWGAPMAREDDAERAVRAGLDLIDAIDELAAELALPQLRARIGVLTGEAAVDVGAVQEGMVIGDTINTAARIQSIAPPGAVLTDDVTRLACERAIAFEPAGEHALKGRSEPVRTWRAMRVLARVGGHGRRGFIEPPFVGRAAELADAKRALERVTSPGAGAELVTILGDAGIGKSRLVWELEKHADGIEAELSWYQARASSLDEGGGFSALAEIVRQRLGVSDGDPAEVQRARIDRRLGETAFADPSEQRRVRRGALRLLGLDDGEDTLEQGELFAGWRALLAPPTATPAVVIVLEELQVADEGLPAFISHLLEWAADAPILILAVGRPDERMRSLAGAGTTIEIGPLDQSEIEALVAGAVRDPPQALLEAIRSDGGGVPLFAVEALRALADGGSLAVADGRYVVTGALTGFEVPATMRALIASRLDRLGTLERRVLIAGAILGERFAAAGAATLAAIDEPDTVALLDGLVAKVLLEHADGPGTGTRGLYQFLQGAIRRVTTSTLARRERKRLHLAAAAYIERSSADGDAQAALAGHLVAALEADRDAGDAGLIRDRARGAMRAAAERAASVAALAESLALFDRALVLTDDERDRAGLLERAGSVAHRAGAGQDAADRYGAAARLHVAAGRTRDGLRARAHELRSLRHLRDPAELLGAQREIDAAAAAESDDVAALAASTLAFTLYQCGRHEEALETAVRAVDVATRCNAAPELLMALAAQASALSELERPDEAITVYRRAIDLSRDRDVVRLAGLTGLLAVSLGSVGRFAEAAERARAGVDAAQATAARFTERWSRLVLGRALCALGEWDAAVAEIEAVRAQLPGFSGMALAPLTVIALARSDGERARELVAEHDRAAAHDGASTYASDYRILRELVLCGDDEVAALVTGAEVADFAEWPGWLAPAVDRLVAVDDDGALIAALSALNGPGRMKRTAPVRAQADRLDAHLTARAGDRERALALWARAEALAAECGQAFERAVIALEACELGGGSAGALAEVAATFHRLGAGSWAARCAASRAGLLS